MAKFKFCVFIGRFSPFHRAHYSIVQEALKQADTAIVILGSARKARDPKNPWTVEQREDMMRKTLTPEENARVKTIHMQDYLYNDNLWLANLQLQVSDIVGDSVEVALIGHAYDHSSYYLKLFPQWTFISYNNLDKIPHATTLRNHYFESKDDYMQFVHPAVANYMEEFRSTDDFLAVQEEHQALEEYKKQWANAPFPPIFTTLDAVVIRSGHVLVVRRGGVHGKNKIALPGGFINPKESIKDGILRELKEETGIKISKDILESSMKEIRVFDHPDRSLRGRTITHCGLIDLGGGTLPVVKGADDAAKAYWLPLRDLENKCDQFFEDHYHIINSFIFNF